MKRPNPLIALLFAASAAVGAGCSQPPANTDSTVSALIERIGKAELARAPEQADLLGVPVQTFGKDYHGLIDDRSIAAAERERVTRLTYVHDLEMVNRATLSAAAARRLDAATFVVEASTRLDRYGYGRVGFGHASPYLISPTEGAYVDLVSLLTQQGPLRTRAEANAWIARLRQVDAAMRDEQQRFEVDIANGAMPPKLVLQQTLDHVRALTPGVAGDHILVARFTEAVSQIPDLSEQEIRGFVADASKVIGERLAPAYKNLAGVLETALKTAPDEPGAWRLQKGDAWYRDALHLYTTTDLSAKDIRTLGLQQAEAVSKQIEPVLQSFGAVDGSIGARLQAMAHDPALVFPDTEEGHAALLAALQSAIDWGASNAEKMATARPRRNVEMRPAPPLTADVSPELIYAPARLDGTRGAVLNLNLGSTLDWPMWRLPALAHHETQPGRHLQAGGERERWNGPVLSLVTANAAFEDGWALYGEDLADEAGAYRADARMRLGYLQSLLLQAALAVADTGIHGERGSRQQAVDYLVSTTGLPRQQMEKAVDRIILYPGEASAALVGRQTIRRLRDSADKEMGRAFDLRAFHDVVLSGGGRPLPILEADVHDWAASRRQPAAAK